MPIRKIPKNAIFVTGRFASAKSRDVQEFESLLERDLMILLEFDAKVATFEPQPLRIPVPGVPQGYVPDLKVVYKDKRRKPDIIEVKKSEFLEQYRNEYAPKFDAASQYCKRAGYRFVILTEKEIRTERLKNLKFLRGYRGAAVDPRHRSAVLSFVRDQKNGTTSESILAARDPSERGELLTAIWAMLIAGDLCADLDAAWGVDVPLWSPQ